MTSSPQRKIAYSVAIASVVIPFLLMLWNVQVGVGLLLLGLVIAYRAIRFSGATDPGVISNAQLQQINRHQGEWGRTIYVQLVDDFGRELPPDIVQKRMAEAYAQANPRDTVIGVHSKITTDAAKPPKA